MAVETVYDSTKSIENDDSEDGTSDMEHDCDKNQLRTVVTGRIAKKVAKKVVEKVPILPDFLEIDGNVQLNRAIKTVLKKHKKQQKKLSKSF